MNESKMTRNDRYFVLLHIEEALYTSSDGEQKVYTFKHNSKYTQ
jgi:hypothetical protein